MFLMFHIFFKNIMLFLIVKFLTYPDVLYFVGTCKLPNQWSEIFVTTLFKKNLLSDTTQD